MKIVVFGGSGFVGSYVVDELMAQGHEVICADLIEPKFTPDVSFHEVDILDPEKISALIDTSVDVVYNFAGFAALDKAILEPLRTVQLNILGNTHILEACRKAKVKRFVFASSAYALSDKGSFYGISKLSSEKIVEEYAAQFDMDYTILRYGSVYGDRADEDNGIYGLLQQALQTKVIRHRGNGEEVREYIHCRDAAKLSVDILAPEYKNKHLILTGLEKLKYKDLLTMLTEIFNNEISIEYVDDADPAHYLVTPYSFRPIIGEKLTNNPYVDLGQGLLECITTMHQQLSGEDK